jgi:hypothetical protein
LALLTPNLFSHRRTVLAKSDDRWSVYKKGITTCYHLSHCRTDINQCRGTTGTTGDVFTVAFLYEYLPECSTTPCQQRTLTNINKNIETDHNKISVPITFTNGQTLTVQLFFCSFGSFSTGKTTCLFSKIERGGIFIRLAHHRNRRRHRGRRIMESGASSFIILWIYLFEIHQILPPP